MSKEQNQQSEIWKGVEEQLGDSEICSRCSATFATMPDKCNAPLDDQCPGFLRIDEVRRPIVAQVYGWKE